jgi:pentatricopeptide repeat protein
MLTTAMVEGLSRKGRAETAWAMIQDMVSRGGVPSDRALQATVYAFCRRGEMQRAAEVWTLMRTYPHTIAQSTVTALVDGYIRASSVSGAVAILEEAAAFGVVPNERMYNLLIVGHCQVGDVQGALRYLRLMQDRGLKPGAFPSVRPSACPVSSLTRARRLCDLQSAGVVVVPSGRDAARAPGGRADGARGRASRPAHLQHADRGLCTCGRRQGCDGRAAGAARPRAQA